MLLVISENLLTESVVAAVGVGLQVEAGELQLDPGAGRHAAVDNIIQGHSVRIFSVRGL